jgi:hypothetical protein
MQTQSYRILIMTGGINARHLAAAMLSRFGSREDQRLGDFSLDIRYRALTDAGAASSFDPHFFIGATLSTRAATSQVTVRTFASRSFQSKRASIYEDEVPTDADDWTVPLANCRSIVDALCDNVGGIVWQSRYDALRESASNGQADVAEITRMWLALPEHMRPTAFPIA